MKNKLSFKEKTKRFFSPIKKNKLTYSIGMLIYFIWGLDRVIHVIFLERIIFYLEAGDSINFNFLLNIYIIYILFYILITFSFRQKGWTEIRDTAIKFIQGIYLKQFINLENNNIERHGTGKLTAIINNGIDRWGKLLDIFLIEFFNLSVSFIFTSYMLYKSNELFLVCFFIVYFLVYISAYYLNLGAIKYRRKRRDNSNYHTKNLVKIIMNKQEIMQSDKIDHELLILDGYKDKEIFYNKKISNFLYPLFEGPNVILAIFIIGLLGYLGNSYLRGDVSISLIVGLISALIVMQGALERGINFFKDFTKDFVDIEKLWDFFDNSPKNRKYNLGEIFKYKKGNIEFVNITYSYVKGNKILSNFSLNIEGGKITALVGSSGGGKSTIAKLVGGYIDYNKGNIFIDGQELNKLSMKTYFKNIGYLTQEPSIFDGTVLENMIYAVNKGITKTRIEEIIKLSKCDFIYDLPNGIDTEIGERGIKLSGGQRQRLAIAKIMLKNPKIIILDEPTSALDSFSEDQITKAMHNLFACRTVIIIAHRLQTVKNADNIFVISEGKVIEEGTHKDLVMLGGNYNKMLELQSGF